MSYRCPKCKNSQSLWAGVEVPGWESVNDELKLSGSRSSDREVFWEQAKEDGTYGCAECQWEGAKLQLERIGTDGEPLRAPIPGQLNLEADS